MSLFKAREWWATTCGHEELHDLDSLCISNLDNSVPPSNKIAVGSFQGLVRVYRPEPGSFSPDHVLIEHQTGQPVLQLEAGRFLQGSRQIQLAVLHPKEVAVYSLSSQSSDDPSGPDQSLSDPSAAFQYQLMLLYRNSFSRTACNMIVGPFGRAEAGDYVCVQSMDGQLSFFVHESFAFAVFLPDFLTPGPLCYLPRTDSIVTANSSRQLQCFQYQALSMAYCGSADVGGRENAGKKPVADWTVNLGDHVISIRIPRQFPGRPTQLLVLGERGVYCYLDTGQLRFMMKLEVNASCVYPYSVVSELGEGGEEEGEDALQYLLATDSGQLQVFQDSSLKWAAALPHPPTDISVATFQELEGVVVSVDELGHLTCSYLGTDPSTFSAPPPSVSRDLNYTEMEREVRELQREIKMAEKGEGEIFDSKCPLVVKTEILGTPRVVELSDSEELDEEEEGVKKCVDIKLTYSSSGVPLHDVTTAISCSLPLTTHPSHIHEVAVTATTSPHTVTVVCTPHSIPAERHVTFTTTFTSGKGGTRVSTETVELPLSLFCQPCIPAKTASHKVTLDTNKPAVSLHSLFPSLLSPASENAPPNAMGFKLLAGPEITIVASKSSERYRLQTEAFPILGMFLDELIRQLERHFSHRRSGEPVFRAGYSGSLPLSDYFELLDQHYALRCDLDQCREVMRRQSLQFRAVQKRLLTRFKDKTPSGLSHLDTLLEGTYRQLMSLAEKSESLGSELRHTDHLLSCGTQLINTLLRLSAELGTEDYAVLTATLSPLVYNSDTEQGWEETVDAAVTHILKTTLAKSNRDKSTVSVAIQDAPLDSQRLKRHIALFCDRVLKGGRLARSGGNQPKADEQRETGATQISNQVVTQQQQTKLSRKLKRPALPALAEETSERHTEM